ncbi:MAG: NAD(P)-dependent glycerol-3-phosphate dehydrogenase [Deltaproteobacteria bacterium]|jgi:glycerol-3-phosphate dehydrogenase (NAD(P)+)|nr:NAD(P)-dependent glycerol-3-phosphate dehydrogenase [Deltaproteobacteria bacterium]
MKITVLGGGSWGTALGSMLAANGKEVALLLRNENAAHEINSRHINNRYLPDIKLHENLKATLKPEEAFAGTEVCLLAIPCQNMRQTLFALTEYFLPGLPVVCASKGLELTTHKTMSAVVREVIPQACYAILSGPSFAKEVALGMPGAVVMACADKILGESLRATFSGARFRVYSSVDVIGVEIGGAIKNVIAIAAGASDGLGFGHNARAALITRGLAEMSRLGAALGANPATFMGLSGMGDLVLTCTGDLSRNRRVGLGLAQGKALHEITEDLHMVAEGVKTTEAAVALGQELGVDLPIAKTVCALLSGEYSPADAVKLLMGRALKEE